jgi:hypothetical protein
LFLAEAMADPAVQSAKAPWHLWVVGVGSLLWNSVGATDFVMTQTRNRAYMRGFTPEQLHYYYGLPAWVVAAWGIAVWGGVLGSLLLLLRKRRAVGLFLASIICMVLTDLNSFVLTDGLKVMGGGTATLAFSAVIFVIGLLLVIYARSTRKRGLLR